MSRVADDVEVFSGAVHWYFKICCCCIITVLCLWTPLAGESNNCLAACCSLFLLPPSYLGSAEESVTQAARQLCVASTTGFPEAWSAFSEETHVCQLFVLVL